jgi:hypothetical protein
MTIHEQTMTKIQQLPESLAQEVSDFIDFLLVKQDQTRWELWTHFNETLALSEADFADYLVITNLFIPLTMGLRRVSYDRILGLSTPHYQESPPCVSSAISSIG